MTLICATDCFATPLNSEIRLRDDAYITQSSDHLHVANFFNAVTDDFPTILGQDRPRSPPDYFLINIETKASSVLPLGL